MVKSQDRREHGSCSSQRWCFRFTLFALQLGIKTLLVLQIVVLTRGSRQKNSADELELSESLKTSCFRLYKQSDAVSTEH